MATGDILKGIIVPLPPVNVKNLSQEQRDFYVSIVKVVDEIIEAITNGKGSLVINKVQSISTMILPLLSPTRDDNGSIYISGTQLCYRDGLGTVRKLTGV